MQVWCLCARESVSLRRVRTLRRQGKIACANVLSDLYSMGIDECDTMLVGWERGDKQYKQYK